MRVIEALREFRAWGMLAAGVGIGILLVGECRDFRRQDPPTPRVAVHVRAVERYRPDVIAPSLRVYVPAPKDAAKLEERVDLPIRGEGDTRPEAHDLLAQVVDPDCGEIVVTLPPAVGEAPREVQVTVIPAPPKLIEWRNLYEIGGLYGIGTGGETRARGWAAVEPLRWGRLHLRGEVGADLRAGVTDGYAMVGVVWRSR